MKTKQLLSTVFLSLALSLALLGALALPGVLAANFNVTTTADGVGAGTLRWAISQANASGAQL